MTAGETANAVLPDLIQFAEPRERCPESSRAVYRWDPINDKAAARSDG